MEIKIINKSNNPLPSFATQGSAGMDLYAFLSENKILQPMERALIPTGISIALPIGYEAQIRPRSGLALKSGITCLNTPGTIDSDYRGEIGIILVNLSSEPFVIQSGDRIAQMIIAKYERPTFVTVNELDETHRGEKGFGSSGVNSLEAK